MSAGPRHPWQAPPTPHPWQEEGPRAATGHLSHTDRKGKRKVAARGDAHANFQEYAGPEAVALFDERKKRLELAATLKELEEKLQQQQDLQEELTEAISATQHLYADAVSRFPEGRAAQRLAAAWEDAPGAPTPHAAQPQAAQPTPATGAAGAPARKGFEECKANTRRRKDKAVRYLVDPKGDIRGRLPAPAAAASSI